jgi:glycosyltransferase involved in cell wall biosynthesis
MEYFKEREPDEALENWPQLKNRRVLLFMGRLSRLKGVALLPQAWADCLKRTQDKDWVLVIAGPDYRGHGASVTRQIRDLGLQQRTLMPGPVYGKAKDSLLACAEAFVLPSYTEGFSVAILEAIAASLPCLYTTECHFRELAEAGGGWNIRLGLETLTQSLANLITLSPEELKTMGHAANELGLRNYTLERISSQLLAMYHDALS